MILLLLLSCGEYEEFTFSTTRADERVDRVGVPGVQVLAIESDDAYNQAEPDDPSFVPQLRSHAATLHTRLDDDLERLGLTPCAVDDCVDQLAPVVLPDVLVVDTTAPPGFPNGRLPSDPAMDVVLALLLLDGSLHGLADLPLNPPTDDLGFTDAFPYLSPPRQDE